MIEFVIIFLPMLVSMTLSFLFFSYIANKSNMNMVLLVVVYCIANFVAGFAIWYSMVDDFHEITKSLAFEAFLIRLCLYALLPAIISSALGYLFAMPYIKGKRKSFSLKCIKNHDWDGCKCKECGEIRDEHKWNDKGYCTICRIKSDELVRKEREEESRQRAEKMFKEKEDCKNGNHDFVVTATGNHSWEDRKYTLCKCKRCGFEKEF